MRAKLYVFSSACLAFPPSVYHKDRPFFRADQKKDAASSWKCVNRTVERVNKTNALFFRVESGVFRGAPRRFPSLYRRRAGPACLFGGMARALRCRGGTLSFGENFGRKQLFFFKIVRKNEFFGHVLFLDFPVFRPRMYVILPFWEVINGAFRSIFLFRWWQRWQLLFEVINVNILIISCLLILRNIRYYKLQITVNEFRFGKSVYKILYYIYEYIYI